MREPIIKTYFKKIPSKEEEIPDDDDDDQVSMNQMNKNQHGCLNLQISCILKIIIVISIVSVITFILLNYNILYIIDIGLDWINGHIVLGFFAFTLIYILSSCNLIFL